MKTVRVAILSLVGSLFMTGVFTSMSANAANRVCINGKCTTSEDRNVTTYYRDGNVTTSPDDRSESDLDAFEGQINSRLAEMRRRAGGTTQKPQPDRNGNTMVIDGYRYQCSGGRLEIKDSGHAYCDGIRISGTRISASGGTPRTAYDDEDSSGDGLH